MQQERKIDVYHAAMLPRTEAIRGVKRMMKSMESVRYGFELTILSDVNFNLNSLSWYDRQCLVALLQASSKPRIYTNGMLLIPQMEEHGDTTVLSFKIDAVTSEDKTMMKLIASTEELDLVDRKLEMLSLRIILDNDVTKIDFNKTHMMFWVKEKPYTDGLSDRDYYWEDGILYVAYTDKELKQLKDGYNILKEL